MVETDRYDASAVSIEDLDYSDDDLYFHDGFPFTGIAFAEDEDGRAEMSYYEGVQDGPMREWYKGGRIKVEALVRGGMHHGEMRTYAEDGTLRELTRYENGIRLVTLYYGVADEPVETFRLVEGSPNHGLLLVFREKYGL